MKDAKGHGSNSRGGPQTPVQAENAPFKSRLGKAAGHSYLDPNDPRAHAHARGTADTPKLQRRHFEAIAAEMRAHPDAGSPEHAKRVSDMADKLATTNPGFRRDYFVAAATPGGKYRNKSNSLTPAEKRQAQRVADYENSLSPEDRAATQARFRGDFSGVGDPRRR